jgi:membrane protease YdiL (CAAX protease family)
MILFGTVFKLSGVDYDDLALSADNTRKAVVFSLIATSVALIVATTLLRWWKSVLRDERRCGGWLIAVPIVILVAILAGIDYSHLGDIDSELLLTIAVGTILVGFSEELMYRGLFIVGARGSMGEQGVWLWSSVACVLLHSINALLGQDIGPTIVQVAVTFVVGSGMYVARRSTGLIIVPMVLHTLWDFSAFTGGAIRDLPDGSASALAGPMQGFAILTVLVAITVGRKHLFPKEA